MYMYDSGTTVTVELIVETKNLEKFEKECEGESGIEEAGQQGEGGDQHSL